MNLAIVLSGQVGSMMVILDKRYASEEDRAEKAEEAAKLFLSISDTLKNQGLRHLSLIHI